MAEFFVQAIPLIIILIHIKVKYATNTNTVSNGWAKEQNK